MLQRSLRSWSLGLMALTLMLTGLLAIQPTSAFAATPSLTDEETDAIAFMREEEKMARDLYLAFDEQYDLPIFSRIAASEQRHFDSVGTLITRYSLDDPAAGNGPGEFTDPALQELYEELLADGSESLAAALNVGVIVEETDIADIEDRLDSVTANDVVRVFTMLKRGSEHHLSAFSKYAND